MEQLGLGSIEVVKGFRVNLVSPQHASIHIKDMKTSTDLERLRYFEDALQKFAHLLASDSRFKDIQTITATSWIVTNAPALLEMFGFTIDHNNEHPSSAMQKRMYRIRQHVPYSDIPKQYRHVDPTLAHISRERLLMTGGSRIRGDTPTTE